MKTLLALLCLLTVSVSFAESRALFRILEGKLHKGGSAYTDVLPDSSRYSVRMGYEIIKRPWAPVPSDVLKGEEVIDLPGEFKDERGYLELEARGTISIPDGEIKFVRRTSLGNKKDAYLLMVYPKNGKSKIEIVYHPELPSVGWGRMKITFISQIPLLNGYEIEMVAK